jgi:CubicO group peptidase (beta-lactamase class C family)
MKRSLLLVGFICLLSILQAQHKSPTIQPLLDSLELILSKEKIPGALISIVCSDSIIFAGGVGYANVEDSIPVTDNHLFRLGSISKTMTTLSLLTLVENNTLNLETPVLDIDPNLPIENKWRNTDPITVEHLLEHTAGFDDMHMHAIYNTTDENAPSCASMIESHKNSLVARWRPGTRWAYSNPGYVMAGHVLEKKTLQSYHQVTKQTVFDPIGMSSSGFYFKEPTEFLMAQGYKREGGKFTPIEYPSIQGGPAGELCSNAADMAAFLQFMLKRKLQDSSELISRSSFNRMEMSKTSFAAKNGLTKGYGLAIFNHWLNGFHFQGHDGGIDGFVSTALYSRDADFGYAVSVNTTKSPAKLARKIRDFFLGHEKSIERLDVPLPENFQSDYEGFYTMQSPRTQLTYFIEYMFDAVEIEIRNDSVFVKELMNGVVDTLYHSGDYKFYSTDEGFPKTLFASTDDAKVLWLRSDTFHKKSKTIHLFKIGLFLLSLFMTVLFFIFGFFWLVINAFKKIKKPLLGHLLLWLSTGSFIAMVVSFIYNAESIGPSNEVTISAVLVTVFSWLFLILALVSIAKYFSLPSKSRFYKVFYLCTAISVTGLGVFLFYNNIIGIQLWNY